MVTRGLDRQLDQVIPDALLPSRSVYDFRGTTTAVAYGTHRRCGPLPPFPQGEANPHRAHARHSNSSPAFLRERLVARVDCFPAPSGPREAFGRSSPPSRPPPHHSSLTLDRSPQVNVQHPPPDGGERFEPPHSLDRPRNPRAYRPGRTCAVGALSGPVIRCAREATRNSSAPGLRILCSPLIPRFPGGRGERAAGADLVRSPASPNICCFERAVSCAALTIGAGLRQKRTAPCDPGRGLRDHRVAVHRSGWGVGARVKSRPRGATVRP